MGEEVITLCDECCRDFRVPISDKQYGKKCDCCGSVRWISQNYNQYDRLVMYSENAGERPLRKEDLARFASHNRVFPESPIWLKVPSEASKTDDRLTVKVCKKLIHRQVEVESADGYSYLMPDRSRLYDLDRDRLVERVYEYWMAAQRQIEASLEECRQWRLGDDELAAYLQ